MAGRSRLAGRTLTYTTSGTAANIEECVSLGGITKVERSKPNKKWPCVCSRGLNRI